MTKITESKRALRKQADLAGIRALADLLRRIGAEPAGYLSDEALWDSLHSQGALAKRAVPSERIQAMSLNHQRRVADEALGAFSTLDDLRRAALEALVRAKAQQKRGNVRSKSGLLARVRELESDNQLLRQDLFLLQRAYDIRCVQARHYAKVAGKNTQELCEREQQEIDATFSLRRKAIRSSNIVDFEERRHVQPGS